MRRVQANLAILHRLWEDSLTIGLIAEPLESVASSEDAATVCDRMKSRNWDVIGVCDGGEAEASAYYLHQQDLKDGHCGQYAQRFEIQDIVAPSAPIYQSLHWLCERKRLFVLGRKGVEGIVSIADLQKQPVRLMLFAAVSLLEMAMLARIRQLFAKEEEWAAKLSEGRIQKARELHAQRGQKGQDIDLADCLCLSDKATILLKSSDECEVWGFTSKHVAEKFFKPVQTLRDNLAHGHDPSQGADWAEICTMFTKAQEITHRMSELHS